MKICPHCQTRYTDDTLKFCLQDGAALTSNDAETSTPTVAFNDEQETLVKSRPTDQIAFDLQNSEQSQNWQQAAVNDTTNFQTEPKKSNTGLLITTTVLATLLIFGIGIAAWFYFGHEKETARDGNVKNSFPDNSVKNKNENSGILSPENTNEKPSVRPTQQQQKPAPEFDAEEVKSEVSDAIDSWQSMAESRNLSAYMNSYADTVDYYRKRGASIGFVRNDKQKAFSTYNNIEIDISNMRVAPDASGETAVVVFDKAWRFQGDEKTSEGKVQQQLQLRKIGGDWKITGEKDLKVYYVN